MWRRAVKVMAVSYAVKTLLLVGVWLAAPDLVRQGRDKVKDVWAAVTGASTPATAAIGQAAPHRAAGAVLQPVGVTAVVEPVSATLP
jgi:hypothetical protein